MASQPERIASLESHQKWQWILQTAVAVVGLGWLSWVSITLFSFKGDMQAIKQKMKDGGLGDVVARLKAPTSPAQLQATLSTITAQIQTARVDETKPDPEKTKKLSTALSEVVEKHPNMPEAWQAVAQLATYKSSPQPRSPLPDCDLQHPVPGGIPYARDGDGTLNFLAYEFRGCTLRLDALPGTATAQWHHDLDFRTQHNGTETGRVQTHGKFTIPIALIDGTLIYAGSDLPVGIEIWVIQSTVQYDIHSVPSRGGQSLLLASLGAPDSNNFYAKAN